MVTPPPKRIVVELQDHVDEQARAAGEVRGFLESHGVTERTCYAVLLAIDELVGNVIRYAFDGPGPHDIRLEAGVETGAVSLVIEDRGRPFDPTRVPAPVIAGSPEAVSVGGRGIALVRSFASTMLYERRDDINHLALRFARVA